MVAHRARVVEDGVDEERVPAEGGGGGLLGPCRGFAGWLEGAGMSV